VLATAHTFTLLGIEARPVRVEVDVQRGLPGFGLVGLPDASVRESRERVRAALINSGFDFPQQRITANLAPADLRKGGPGLDLAIAAALLGSCGNLPPNALDGAAFAGELALDGSIHPVPGTLAMAEAARAGGFRTLGVPVANAPEAALVGGLDVMPLRNLGELQLIGIEGALESPPPLRLVASTNGEGPDFAELRGQAGLRRAMELAAAGAHNLMIVGPPGAGKSMAARRAPSILPPLGEAEAVEVLRIQSACGVTLATGALPLHRPFRAPHHTISAAGLVGGGNPPRAGQITLAHRGVLFCDELAEFPRDALEALREPLESGVVSIVRAGYAVELPCRFMLIAAANPCPCGHGPESIDCHCSDMQVRRYQARLSGALADRIDISIRVRAPKGEELGAAVGEASKAVRERVIEARERQYARLGGTRTNSEMTPRETRENSRLDPEAAAVLEAGYSTLRLSGRGWDRTLRLARTIADLDGSDTVRSPHVSEALALRRRGDA
jgi:magnesium chelatase family protein